MTTPFDDYLQRLHASLSDLSSGSVADYIPELAKARPDAFAIAFATIDGQVYSCGDCSERFTIQSVSKPFAYGTALERLGAASMLKKVGVEPTGEAFNSIVLDELNNRPFNPMVNAGAIAVAALTEGQGTANRIEQMRRTFSAFAGRDLEIDQSVYASESATGRRNRAIAWLMLNTDMFDGDPDEVLDIYFSQCALSIDCRDLALMGATLANNGVNPRTRARILSPACVRDVTTLMSTCGMYDYAGEWSYDVGLPAKSGVSGAILAILPGQLAISVWSPPIDQIGNSVRGVAACKQISEDFGLHVFMNAAAVENVIRRESTANKRNSMRIRNPKERALLDAEGHRIAIVEIQGALYFASAERLVRRLGDIIETADYLVLDFARLGSVDAAAQRFLEDFLVLAREKGTQIALCDLPEAADCGTQDGLRAIAKRTDALRMLSADHALEIFEDRILDALLEGYDSTRFALNQITLFDGLVAEHLRLIEGVLRPMQFEANEKILSVGSDGRMLFLVARGSVSVRVANASGGDTRVSCIGPGQFFGEMAILGDARRSADVYADERVICYGLTRDDLEMIGQTSPEVLATVMMNMSREFAVRIRRTNALLSERL